MLPFWHLDIYNRYFIATFCSNCSVTCLQQCLLQLLVYLLIFSQMQCCYNIDFCQACFLPRFGHKRLDTLTEWDRLKGLQGRRNPGRLSQFHIWLVGCSPALCLEPSLMEMRATWQPQYAIGFKGITSLEGDASQFVKLGNWAMKEQMSFNMGWKAWEAMVGYGAQLFRGKHRVHICSELKEIVFHVFLYCRAIRWDGNEIPECNVNAIVF